MLRAEREPQRPGHHVDSRSFALLRGRVWTRFTQFERHVENFSGMLMSRPTTPWNLPAKDLDLAIGVIEGDIREFDSSRLLVTGGTGFIGKWILATILSAVDRLNLRTRIDVISRGDLSHLLQEFSFVGHLRGDVRSIAIDRTYDLIIHGAASSSAPFGKGDGAPEAMASTIIDGTRRMIEIGGRTRARVLFFSSGAVYGPQIHPVAEDAIGAPDPRDPRSAYGLAKRLAENYVAIATSENMIDGVIARLFAFVGPGIPLDAHYAVGNFLNDILHMRPIEVLGDGRPLRSYLYCGDLSEWCWALIARGQSGGAYNVGSPESVSIADLAQRAAAIVEPNSSVRILESVEAGPAPCYVPITELSRRDLDLEPRTTLEDALRQTFEWLTADRLRVV